MIKDNELPTWLTKQYVHASEANRALYERSVKTSRESTVMDKGFWRSINWHTRATRATR
jgi:hypothetical protein